jgi:Predicted acyl esterases
MITWVINQLPFRSAPTWLLTINFRQIRRVVSKYAHEIDLDSENTTDLYPVLQKIGAEVGIPVKSIPHVRNHLRRAIAGFRVLRDIKIPVRDGNYILGDIYLPPEGKFPALVSATVYGKRVVYSGPKHDDRDEIAAFEKAEDDWHSTSTDFPLRIPNTGPWFGNWTRQRVYETIGTFNTFYWVPRGYAMVKIDPRECHKHQGQEVSLYPLRNQVTSAMP